MGDGEVLCRVLDTRVNFGAAYSRPLFESLESGHGPPIFGWWAVSLDSGRQADF